MEKSKFIENLVGDLTPSRQWLPSSRAALWWLLTILANAVVMALIQSYRPNFMKHLLNFPRFGIEIFSSFLFCVVLVYWVYSSLIPGNKISKVAISIGIISGITLVGMLLMSFFIMSPPASNLGARAHCVEEVFIFGLVGMLSFLYFLKKIDFTVSWEKYIAMGLCAGLIPATLMQMACMYDPTHSLLWHYGPVLLISLMALLLPKLSRIFKSE